MLYVNEIFGPTFQGEGSSIGRRCMFLRLGGCNLDCCWCDTPYTWDRKHFPEPPGSWLDFTAINDKLKAVPVQMLVISGGEPLLQQSALAQFIVSCGFTWVEVETNGTIMPSDAMLKAVAQFNVSPKLANSQVSRKRRLNFEALNTFATLGNAIFKFVCTNDADLAEVAQIVQLAQIPADLVYVMPEGTTTEKVSTTLRQLAQPVLERGWNLTLRLHVLVWDNVRGR